MRAERQKNEQEGAVFSEDFPPLSSLGSEQSRNSHPYFTAGRLRSVKQNRKASCLRDSTKGTLDLRSLA